MKRKYIKALSKRNISIFFIIFTLTILDFLLNTFVVPRDMYSLYLVDIALDFLALVILTIIAHGSALNYDVKSKVNIMFNCLLLVNAVAVFIDALCWIVQDNPNLIWENHVLNYLYYMCSSASFNVFWLYCKEVLSLKNKFTKKIDIIIWILSGLVAVLLIVNIPTGFLFTVNSNGTYSRNHGYFVFMSLIFSMMAIEMITICLSQNPVSEKVTFVLYNIAPLICTLVQTLVFGVSIIYIGFMLSLIIMYINIQIARNKEFSQMESSMLLGQIKPHFIQNCLANIKGLMYIDQDLAESMIMNLSGYMRDTFTFMDERQLISFEKEIELSDFYLAIESIRFPDKFVVEKNFEIVDFYIPPLSLEPIIENALKHGIREKMEQGRLIIETKKVDNNVQIIVKDDGVGFDMKTHKPGVGLSNVKRRLLLMTGGTVETKSEVGKGTEVTITLPRKEKK